MPNRHPLIAVVVAATLILPATTQQAEATEVTVKINPCVELLSVIFRLAGSPEYGQGKVDVYTKAVEAHFAAYKNDPVINLAATLRRKQGVSYDAVMGLAVHLDGTTGFAPAVAMSPRPKSLDERWKSSAPRFVRAAQKFATKSKFADFFEAHEALYAKTVERMRARLAESAKLEWFDAFFGERPTAKFEVSLGLLNGGACYGPRLLHRDGTEDLHCVLGVWQIDDEGMPKFDEDVISTVIHEFCHSYCNHLVEANSKAMAKAGKRLFPHVENSMRQQAYGNWETMLKESLVRACVIRYLATTKGPRARQMEIRMQERRQFYWAGDLSDLLIEYEKDRDQYPTLGAFMPRVIEFFDEYSERFDDEMAKRPQVVSTIPEIGDRKVDPNLKEVVITFNTKMKDRAWAFVGGGPKYPKTTDKPRYDKACRVITLPVALEPDKEYEFWLNRGKYDSFQSSTGQRLESVHVTFRTAKK